MVYVLSKDGQPLMPTKRHWKVRRLLKSGRAVVIRSCPFTIQLTYESTTHTQPVSLGIDAGNEAYRNADDSDRLSKEIEFLRFDTALRINQLEEKIIEDRLELTALSATLSSLIEEVNTIRKGR